MNIPRLFSALLLSLLAASCKSSKSEYEDPYVSNFGNDGGYNPYPGSGEFSQPSYSSPSTPSYEAPPSDPYSFSAPSTPAPKPSTTTASKPKTSTASKPAVKKPTSRTHTVVRGDTLYGLARKYGSTVSKIKSANGLSGDLIRIGQKLKIP